MFFETDPAKRAEWRPIKEFREGPGTTDELVIVIDINDPKGVTVAYVDDVYYEGGPWTHFAELPLLTDEMVEKLKEEM